MGGHHLILGQLKDYLTGETLEDTLDERLRQGIARLLVEQKGYDPAQITPRYELEIRANEKCARLLITYLVMHQSQVAMVIQYGPGSLVTRHRPALAISRLVAQYQVPVVVVTNGEGADILKGSDGTVLASGLERIPEAPALADLSNQHLWEPVDAERKEMESRILMAYEVDGKCPCDDSTCKID